jgi:radical SAM-linked protein
MHRLRLKFSRGDQLKFLSHLDLMRLWERALRRAGISPAYSEGFSPHPRISLAAPLAVGVTSQAEMMDLFLENRISPDTFIERIGPQLPEGISIVEIAAVNIQAPSMQSRLRLAEYVVVVETASPAEHMQDRIKGLLAKEQFPWHHSRDTGERYYDLRPLIDDLWLEGKQENTGRIGMRLRCDASGTGRPEQVTRALGYEGFPLSIERTKLIFG